jgi:hypothetical protein
MEQYKECRTESFLAVRVLSDDTELKENRLLVIPINSCNFSSYKCQQIPRVRVLLVMVIFSRLARILLTLYEYILPCSQRPGEPDNSSQHTTKLFI